MKWIIILLLIAAGVWAYLNVDFTGAKNNAQDSAINAIKNAFLSNLAFFIRTLHFFYIKYLTNILFSIICKIPLFYFRFFDIFSKK